MKSNTLIFFICALSWFFSGEKIEASMQLSRMKMFRSGCLSWIHLFQRDHSKLVTKCAEYFANGAEMPAVLEKFKRAQFTNGQKMQLFSSLHEANLTPLFFEMHEKSKQPSAPKQKMPWYKNLSINFHRALTFTTASLRNLRRVIPGQACTEEHPGFDSINEDILLGEIPTAWSKKLVVKRLHDGRECPGAILSIVEPWEISLGSTSPFMPTPLKRIMPSEWLKEGIVNHIITVRDHTTLTLDQMKEATQFIKDQQKNGCRVEVHCAAGKSRSLSVVMASLIRNEIEEQNNVEEKSDQFIHRIFDEVKSKRPEVHLSEIKEASLEEYIEHLRNNLRQHK